MIRRANETLAKFTANLERDALYAFRWSDDAVHAAAEKQVALSTQNALDKGASYRQIVEYWENEACRLADQLARSTSPNSNSTEDARRAVVVRFSRELRRSFDARAIDIGIIYEASL
jgi:hypothetical protein